MSLLNMLFGTRKVFWTCACKYAHKSIRNISLSEATTNSLINHENFTQDLKSAVNSRQVLYMVSANLPQFENVHIMQTLKTLFQLQKQGSSEDIINNENFILLCKKLNKNCRALEINDSIEALKILTYLGVPCSSQISVALLHIIKHSLNQLPLQNVIFLDFLLRKYPNPTPLVEAMLIALPMAFELQLRTVIDHENVNELIEYLQYASKKSLAHNCVQSIISALTLHGEELSIYAAKSIVWSLCDMPHFETTYCRLLDNSIKVMKNNIMKLTFREMEKTLTKILQKYSQDNIYFYDEELFDKCAEYVISNKCDIMQISWIMRKLMRLGHLNIPLLNYMEEQIVQQPQLLSEARPTIFFSVTASYAFADYKSKNWEIISEAIKANELLTNGKDELPWTKFAVDMAVFDCFDDNLLRRIFSPVFLQTFLARRLNKLDYLQLLLLNQAVKTLYKEYEGPFPSQDIINHAVELNKNPHESPVKSALIRAVKNEKYIADGVLSKLGHVIDHVIVMKNGTPLPISQAIDQDTIYIEDIVVPEDSTIICILCLYKGSYTVNSQRLKGNFRLMIRTLESLDYKVLPIAVHTFKNLDDREKIPYIMQGIHEKSIDISK